MFLRLYLSCKAYLKKRGFIVTDDHNMVRKALQQNRCLFISDRAIEKTSISSCIFLRGIFLGQPKFL